MERCNQNFILVGDVV